MRDLLGFIYAALVIFAVIGGAGYSFYSGQPQFGVALLLLGVWLGLGFFNIVKLPTKDEL